MNTPFKNTKRLILLILVALIFFVAIFAGFLTPQDPYASSFLDASQPPSAEHWCGTDSLGRDIFSRIIMGTQTSVLAALVLILSSVTIGVVVGLFAGFYGGKVDMVIMRVVDTMLSFPDLILALAIIGIFGMGLLSAMGAIIAVSWSKYARLSRSLVMKVKSSEYLVAAMTNGTSRAKTLFIHILPNIIPTIFVNGAMDIGGMILTLASLSFLGVGITPPTPEWGYMLNEGRGAFLTQPWLVFCPGAAILIVVIIFNLFGDSMRDAFDTRGKQS